MELRHLTSFKTIVKMGGFKKAADYLGYAQSTITAHIHELESELGQPLFDRLGKNISLTQAGKSFLPYAMDIMELYSRSKEAINQTNEPVGQLTLGASESVLVYLMPELVMEFMHVYPKVELTLKPLFYDKLSEQLKSGDVDIGIFLESSDWRLEELDLQHMREESLSLVQSAARSDRSDVMLFTEPSCSYHPIFEEYLISMGKSPTSKIEMQSIEAIKKTVMCGLGKSFLPNFTVRQEIENGVLLEIPYDTRHYPISVYVATHKKKWHSANVEAFMDFINKCPQFAEKRHEKGRK